MTFAAALVILGALSALPRLDRYVLREVLVPFSLAVAVVALVVFLVQLQRLATAALGLGLTATDVALIFVAALPPFLILAIPIAYLLSVVMGLGRLSTDREIVALRAAGASPTRISRAVILSGAIVSAACIPLAHFGEPLGLNLLYERLVDVGLRNIAQAIRPGVFNEDFGNLALFTKSRDATGQLADVLVYDERDPENPILLLAKTGRLQPRERAKLGPILQLELRDGEIHLGTGSKADTYERVRFESAAIGIDPGQELRERTRFVSLVGRMSSADMIAEGNRRGPNDRQGRRIMKTYWRRYAFPLMAFVFSFIGAAIVISGGASARARNALLALGAVAVYYVLVRVGDYLVLQYSHTAFLAAFGPNLVVLIVGWLWLRRAGRAIG